MDLNELQARRDAAIANGERWPCSAGELLAAYAAGERDFRHANLESANLYRANLESANLRSADLRRADLRSADLRYADLRHADLESAYLRHADLESAVLESANLYSANLYSANLESAVLESANLVSANLRHADLESANLTSAVLESANLYRADLTSADLPERFHILQIAPVGSRRAELQARIDVDGTQTVRTGCFRGTLDEFKAAVAQKPDGDPYRLEYEKIVIPAIEAFFELHTVKQEA